MSVTLRRAPGRVVSALAALATLVLLATAAPRASAHSLDSSTISIHVTDDSVSATISLAVATLDEALGTSHAQETDVSSYADDVIAYIDEHLTVTGAAGAVWNETFSNPVRESVEGIESFSVDVDFDTAGGDTSSFTLAYDAIVEAVAGHAAVVVLTGPDGDVSTPGVIDTAGASVTIVSAGNDVAIGDMVEYGFEHVLDGADHLLFLSALLLPAPLVAVAGRWRNGGSTATAVRKVVHVVTAFTVGHSVTLIASALGWISVPSRLVEVVIAASVGVSAIHAMRPLADRGEPVIAVAFGLVHGLAFAGILSDLGLESTTSLLALLSFNVGIEFAQLLAIAFVFPSVLTFSRTRFADGFRVAGASLALVASLGWALERVGVIDNPLAPVEDAAIGHPWRVVGGLALAATVAWVADRAPGSQRAHHPARSLSR